MFRDDLQGLACRASEFQKPKSQHAVSKQGFNIADHESAEESRNPEFDTHSALQLLV